MCQFWLFLVELESNFALPCEPDVVITPTAILVELMRRAKYPCNKWLITQSYANRLGNGAIASSHSIKNEFPVPKKTICVYGNSCYWSHGDMIDLWTLVGCDAIGTSTTTNALRLSNNALLITRYQQKCQLFKYNYDYFCGLVSVFPSILNEREKNQAASDISTLRKILIVDDKELQELHYELYMCVVSINPIVDLGYTQIYNTVDETLQVEAPESFHTTVHAGSISTTEGLAKLRKQGRKKKNVTSFRNIYGQQFEQPQKMFWEDMEPSQQIEMIKIMEKIYPSICRQQHRFNKRQRNKETSAVDWQRLLDLDLAAQVLENHPAIDFVNVQAEPQSVDILSELVDTHVKVSQEITRKPITLAPSVKQLGESLLAHLLDCQDLPKVVLSSKWKKQGPKCITFICGWVLNDDDENLIVRWLKFKLNSIVCWINSSNKNWKQLIANYEGNDSRVLMVKGDFQNTIKSFLVAPLIANNDSSDDSSDEEEDDSAFDPKDVAEANARVEAACHKEVAIEAESIAASKAREQVCAKEEEERQHRRALAESEEIIRRQCQGSIRLIDGDIYDTYGESSKTVFDSNVDEAFDDLFNCSRTRSPPPPYVEVEQPVVTALITPPSGLTRRERAIWIRTHAQTVGGLLPVAPIVQQSKPLVNVEKQNKKNSYKLLGSKSKFSKTVKND